MGTHPKLLTHNLGTNGYVFGQLNSKHKNEADFGPGLGWKLREPPCGSLEPLKPPGKNSVTVVPKCQSFSILVNSLALTVNFNHSPVHRGP